MFVKYNGVLVIGNCKKSSMNIMLIPPNGRRLDFYFCSFKCIVASRVQPTIDVLLIMMNWILGHTSLIMLGLVIVAYLLIDNPNNECILVPIINNVAFAVYVATWSFYWFFVVKKQSWITLIICVFLVPTTFPICCNIWLVVVLLMKFSNEVVCKSFNLYFFLLCF